MRIGRLASEALSSVVGLPIVAAISTLFPNEIRA